MNLEAEEVRLDPDTTKNREGRVIYLTGELLETMRAQRAFVPASQKERGDIIPWVFIDPETGDRIRDLSSTASVKKP